MMTEFPAAYPAAPAPRASGLSTASLALGIISIPATCVCVGPLLAIVAIILGGVAAARAKRQPESEGGMGRAVGGIVTGAITLVLTGVIALSGGAMVSSLWKSGVFHNAADMAQLESALQAYQRAHQDYPPDLDTLVADGLVQPNPFGGKGSSAAPLSGFTYVTDIHPSDPPHWILAHQPITFGPMKMVTVFYANGTNVVLEQGEFAAAMAKFQSEYAAARGKPPTLLAPGGASVAPAQPEPASRPAAVTAPLD